MNQTGKFFRSRTERFAFPEEKFFPGNNKQRIRIRELRYSLRLKNPFQFFKIAIPVAKEPKNKAPHYTNEHIPPHSHHISRISRSVINTQICYGLINIHALIPYLVQTSGSAEVPFNLAIVLGNLSTGRPYDE